MRKEPFTVGSYVHVVKRGSRGMSIVRDDTDRWRFLLMLRHLNDKYMSENWFRDLTDEGINRTFERPKHWPAQEKIVKVLCFCLLDNHFHLLLKEIKEGGITLFMKRVATSMANHFNAKYKEKGALFQGAYRSRTINDDGYLRYVSAYIQAKNTFELFKGGADEALKKFDTAYEWASKYPYSSLGDYVETRQSPIIEKDILGKLFTPTEYKRFSKEVVFGRANIEIEENLLE